jgi:DNA-binding transcriptional LysR family regulator
VVVAVDLDSMRYVVSLAEELHFGRAAQRHYIVPQAFGRRIQRLEGELGTRLFERSSRRVALTPAGAAFVSRARQLLAMADELARQARDEPSADGSVLRVGVLGFGLADRWPQVRDLLAAQYPDLVLDHVEVDWDSQYDAVRAGEVDVAVAHDVGPEDGLVFDRVLNIARVAVVPARSAYADADRLTTADVAGAQWVRPLGRHPGLADWAGPAAGHGRSSVTVRTPAAVPAAVATSGQLGMHGEPAGRFFARPDVRFIPLAGTPAVVSVVSRAGDRRPAVLAFRRAARAHADRNFLGT